MKTSAERLQYAKEYREKYKKKISKSKSEYYQLNKEKIAEKRKQWRKNNPEKSKELDHENYLRKALRCVKKI